MVARCFFRKITYLIYCHFFVKKVKKSPIFRILNSGPIEIKISALTCGYAQALPEAILSRFKTIRLFCAIQ